MARTRAKTLAATLLAALAALPALADDGDTVGLEGKLEGEKGGRRTTLRLLKETKLKKLLSGDRFEASGVELAAGALWVVFDDRKDVAKVSLDLSRGEWVEAGGAGPGYEGIAWSSALKRFLCVVESDRHDGRFEGRLAEYDAGFDFVDETWLKGVELPAANKGYEGVATLERDGKTYALVLHEGDQDTADDDGSVRGRIEVYRRKADGEGWKHHGTLKLPKSVDFADYAGIDVQDGRVAVVSQTSARLWVGTLEPDAWQWKDKGREYAFPGEGSGDGKPYTSIEGVAWLDAGRVACVSDLLPDGARGEAHDESIHIFALNAGAE